MDNSFRIYIKQNQFTEYDTIVAIVNKLDKGTHKTKFIFREKKFTEDDNFFQKLKDLVVEFEKEWEFWKDKQESDFRDLDAERFAHNPSEGELR